MPADKLWQFDTTSNAGVAYLDNYTERNDATMTTVYVGDHYELNTSTATATSYYFFNGQRVALRTRNMNTGVMNVYWLHGDMLGSASLVTDAAGNPVGQTRYKPFGETRTELSSYLTDRKFIPQFAALTRDVPPASAKSRRSAGYTTTARASTTRCWGGSSRRTASCPTPPTRKALTGIATCGTCR